ncbi:MAG: outer membrane lipoprotein chaperone LolA [Halieaceae bacterium]|jgi:outer membrane lipoprotein carrier protein|nr:outer membrane lipoprotein chaperone LolA [Halieaceae bacterium]
MALRLLLCLLLAGWLPAAAEVEDPMLELAQRLSAFDQLSGAFTQRLLGEKGEILEESAGSFALLRPGFLRWHIERPEEQLLLVSGDSLWHYDVELETATQRRIAQGDPTSPLTILGGDPDTLAGFYAVSLPQPDRFLLNPRFTDADFVAVALVFENGRPTGLDIEDRMGRTARISLSLDASSSRLSPADFMFVPPAGVDVYQNVR